MNIVRFTLVVNISESLWRWWPFDFDLFDDMEDEGMTVLFVARSTLFVFEYDLNVHR